MAQKQILAGIYIGDIPVHQDPNITDTFVTPAGNELVTLDNGLIPLSQLPGDDLIVSKISTGTETNRVWSAAYLTTVIGDLETALDTILGI